MSNLNNMRKNNKCYYYYYYYSPKIPIRIPIRLQSLDPTFRGSEVSAGGGVSSCSMNIDCCHSELVPATGSNVYQPHTLF